MSENYKINEVLGKATGCINRAKDSFNRHPFFYGALSLVLFSPYFVFYELPRMQAEKARLEAAFLDGINASVCVKLGPGENLSGRMKPGEIMFMNSSGLSRDRSFMNFMPSVNKSGADVHINDRRAIVTFDEDELKDGRRVSFPYRCGPFLANTQS